MTVQRSNYREIGHFLNLKVYIENIVLSKIKRSPAFSTFKSEHDDVLSRYLDVITGNRDVDFVGVAPFEINDEKNISDENLFYIFLNSHWGCINSNTSTFYHCSVGGVGVRSRVTTCG